MTFLKNKIQATFSVIRVVFSTFSRIHYEFSVFCANAIWLNYQFANWLWIHFLSCEFTKNSLSFSWILYEFSMFCANSLSFRELTMYLLFFRELTINSLSTSWIHSKFTIFLANSEWIDYSFREFSINFLANLHFFFAKWLLIHYFPRKFILNSPSFSRIQYGFTNLIENFL